MKTFQCDNCGAEVFFENDRCIRCGHWLGYVPAIREMRAFKGPEAGKTEEPRLELADVEYRPCANWLQYKVCNWLVPSTDKQAFCPACRMNELIPDLSVAGNLDRWQKMELAKRRCLYTLHYLSLPTDAQEGGIPLRFRFLAETPVEPYVTTGHLSGLITVNIVEADEDERERRRIRLREPYRTVVGHFRHELGHYYWERLISNSANLAAFRKVFGDESADYGTALRSYYENGPKPEAVQMTVTAYAAAHPWEDWAETWAHYMHIVDMMETALAFGLVLEGARYRELASHLTGRNKLPLTALSFDELLKQWLPLTCALNMINRGMGLQDLYPFVLTPAVCDKLRFIHETVQTCALEHSKAA